MPRRPSGLMGQSNPDLAEAISALRAIQVPETAYPSPPQNKTRTSHADDTNEEEQYEHDPLEVVPDPDPESKAPLPPVRVHIDASLLIEGEGNTIVVPQTARPVNSSSASGPTTSHDLAGPTPSASDRTPHAPPNNTRVQAITSAVLTALRNSHTLEPRYRLGERALELHVDGSLTIRGSENKIYNGTPKARPVESQGGLTAGEAGQAVEPGARKRRSQSEPAEDPKSKKRA